MKTIIALFLIISSSALLAKENYECEVFGPNYKLTINDDGAITLANALKSYTCQKGRESLPLPGADIELNVLRCESSFSKVDFYYAVKDDGNIILSRNIGTSQDILCSKI